MKGNMRLYRFKKFCVAVNFSSERLIEDTEADNFDHVADLIFECIAQKYAIFSSDIDDYLLDDTACLLDDRYKPQAGEAIVNI